MRTNRLWGAGKAVCPVGRTMAITEAHEKPGRATKEGAQPLFTGDKEKYVRAMFS